MGGHCKLGAVAAILDDIGVVGKSHLARNGVTEHTVIGANVNGICNDLFRTDIAVLAKLDIAPLTENYNSSVSPGINALWRAPVNTDIARNTVIGGYGEISEVIPVAVLCEVAAEVVVYPCRVNGCIVSSRVFKELLKLM